jgi:hypothetical protein
MIRPLPGMHSSPAPRFAFLHNRTLRHYDKARELPSIFSLSKNRDAKLQLPEVVTARFTEAVKKQDQRIRLIRIVVLGFEQPIGERFTVGIFVNPRFETIGGILLRVRPDLQRAKSHHDEGRS